MPDQAGRLVRQPSWSRTNRQGLGWKYPRILCVERCRFEMSIKGDGLKFK
ncbi:hypothetical protein PspLS_03026 [Pyricularia sp. CBS 133598]|nr:hypothetical protein PspLS_03026 [Pyricularia sp. CBS 133598]